MWIKFKDGTNIQSTVVPHGQVVRQGDGFDIFLAIGTRTDYENFSLIYRKPSDTGTIISQTIDASDFERIVFTKINDAEVTYDFKSNETYNVAHFSIAAGSDITSESGNLQIEFRYTATGSTTTLTTKVSVYVEPSLNPIASPYITPSQYQTLLNLIFQNVYPKASNWDIVDNAPVNPTYSSVKYISYRGVTCFYGTCLVNNAVSDFTLVATATAANRTLSGDSYVSGKLADGTDREGKVISEGGKLKFLIGPANAGETIYFNGILSVKYNDETVEEPSDIEHSPYVEQSGNTALSGEFIPSVDEAVNIGSSEKKLLNLYVKHLYAENVNGGVRNVKLNGTSVVDANYDAILNLVKSDVGLSNVDNTSDANKPVSTAQGLINTDLQNQINNLASRGRFLSGWNCFSGLPTTNPGTLPYTYKTGDYYIIDAIDKVSDYSEYDSTQTYNIGAKVKKTYALLQVTYYICKTDGTTGEWDASKWREHTIANYIPSGTQYTGEASIITTQTKVNVNDQYVFDGTNWLYLDNTETEILFSNIGGSPYGNTSLAMALASKQSTITSSNKLSSDLVDDTDKTNKFVTANDKSTWNAKYTKPADGIPSTDLTNGVQNMLSLANTAVQPSTLTSYYTKVESDAAFLKGVKVGGTELQKDSDGKVNVPVASSSDLGAVKTGMGATVDGNGNLQASVLLYPTYGSASSNLFISKGTLENVLDNETIRVDKVQSLSAEQKAKARANIGAGEDSYAHKITVW